MTLLMAALVMGAGTMWATSYVPVTSTSQLVAGKNYLIVNRYKTSKMTDPTWISFGDYNSSKSYYGSTVVTVSGDIDDFSALSVTSSESAHVLTLGGETDSWTLYDNTDEKYVALTNNSNNIHQATDETLNTSQWTISINSSTYVATISNKETTDRSIRGNQSNTRFACYTGSQNGNVEYLFVELAESDDPSISANNVNLAYNETSGSIAYTVNKGVDGGALTAALTEVSDWLTVGIVSSSSVALTATENTGAARTATVRLTYTYDTDKTLAKDVTVTQAKVAKVIDGYFDFTYADELDYGTGLTPSGTDIKEAKTFTAGNITVTPEPTATNKYWRWWTDNTLRLYTDTKMTIAAADGYVITKIDFVGTQNLDAIIASIGSYVSGNDKKSATWTGCANSIIFTRNNSNPFFTTITVTYSPSYKQAVSSYGWATLIAPDVPVSFAANDAYVVSAADVVKQTITVTPVTSVPAGTPVLLKGEGEKTITVAASASAPETNLLEVCDGTAAATGYNYFVLAQDGASAAFMQWTGDLSDIKGRVVLPLSLDLTSSGARLLRIIDDEATGIAHIENASVMERETYNLNGQRVSSPKKGLYIVNGKKVIMK